MEFSECFNSPSVLLEFPLAFVYPSMSVCLSFILPNGPITHLYNTKRRIYINLARRFLIRSYCFVNSSTSTNLASGGSLILHVRVLYSSHFILPPFLFGSALEIRDLILLPRSKYLFYVDIFVCVYTGTFLHV